MTKINQTRQPLKQNRSESKEAVAHVVVVVNANGNHWVPVVIDMHAKTLTYMDSLAAAEANEPVPTSAKETMGHLLRYLDDEHRARHNTSLPDEWSRGTAMRGGTNHRHL